MDTSVLNIVKQLNRPKKASPFQRILRTIDGICIEGALSILQAFNYRDERLFLSDGREVRAEDLAEEKKFPELQGRTAEETPVVWFWGGPPTALHWYEGTLYTLLLDRIFCECDTVGVEHVAKWIGIDDES